MSTALNHPPRPNYYRARRYLNARPVPATLRVLAFWFVVTLGGFSAGALAGGAIAALTMTTAYFYGISPAFFTWGHNVMEYLFISAATCAGMATIYVQVMIVEDLRGFIANALD